VGPAIPDFAAAQKSLQGQTGVPRNYEEFARMYYDTIKRIVSGFTGIDREDVEDYTQEIVKQFVAGDFLKIYSADVQSVYAEARYQTQVKEFHQGNRDFMPAKFTGKFPSFLYTFTTRRLLGFRDKFNRRVTTMKSLDSYVDSTESEDQETPLLVFFGIPDSEFQNIETRELLRKAYNYLCKIANATTTRNFPELFITAVNDTFNSPEGFDREAYAAQKGITVSAVSMQLRELRLYLSRSGFYSDLKDIINKRAR
jgi:hypothetical protein